ncbi:BCCT family transporter [Rhodobacteraceae bacterium W635]|nr:BCCT family transporter [Rhodobacteraceae bacterium W635]
MNPPVFLGSAGLIVVFVLYGVLFSGEAETQFSRAQGWLIDSFGWFYVLAASFMLGFVIWLGLSRLGEIRLGGDDARPEFGRLTWFTMLMAAGMGIGLVFFGVAEPILHYTSPLDAEPRSDAAVREALFHSYFHWGLHPWAIYICMALPLAYFHFRHELPLAPRSLLYPLIGERIKGWVGHMVDIIATVGTLFGVGTSLGLGAMQINAGLGVLTGLGMSLPVQLTIIAVITGIATVSVVSGLHVGIRRLSEFNMGVAALLLAFVLVAGPTILILETFTAGIGAYMSDIVEASFRVGAASDPDWQADWTLFYWVWWISWSPFVGIFAARISRGRTIREMIAGMLLAPTLLGFFWFAAFGGTALSLESAGIGRIAEMSMEDEALSLYAMLAEMPLSMVTSALATLAIVVFFITSSDSGSLVDVMVTSGGHPNPPAPYRVFWCVTEGVVAMSLLSAGGLIAMRTASLTSALPLTVFLLVACIGLVRALRVDAAIKGAPHRAQIAPD